MRTNEIMEKTSAFLRHHIWMVLLVIGVVGVLSAYVYTRSGEEETKQYAVIETVERGTVSSGIETTGEIIAAHTLDLDVYKQTKRIEAVRVTNGSKVIKDQVLFSFDKSNSYVDVESSHVQVLEAELSLSTEKENATDPNSSLRTLEGDIENLAASIEIAQRDIQTAYRDFLNANLSAEPDNTTTRNRERPAISGAYTGTEKGEYRITIYSSQSISGYSYRVTGLETDIESVRDGIVTPLGTKGLTIRFPDDMKGGDEWVVTLPNTHVGEYTQNKEAYEKKVAELNKNISGYKTDSINKQQEIEDVRQSDTTSYRNLNVSKAQATLSEARAQLNNNYDVVREQDIVAPFSGTIEGIENIVVGATPTGGTEDATSLGTLISDEFLVKFSLGAQDVSRIKVGQKVLVTVTSYPNVPPVEASITEISSLPDESGVAQYTVQALIATSTESKIQLREGLLADVEIVEKEVENVLRIPLSAVFYENGEAKVNVLGDVTEAQQDELNRSGIISMEAGKILPTYPVNVTIGVSGIYYAEVTEGLEEGMKVVVSTSSEAEDVVENARFGPPGEGNQNRNNTNSQNSPNDESSMKREEDPIRELT